MFLLYFNKYYLLLIALHFTNFKGRGNLFYILLYIFYRILNGYGLL